MLPISINFKGDVYMASFKPDTTYTVEQFIQAGRMTTVSYDKFSYKEALSNGTVVSILNVVDDYIPEISDYIVNVELNKEQYLKYRFKPKLLCHDIYGNGEVYWIIMRINGIIDVKEFDFKVLKMLRVDDLNTLLTNIYNAEYKWMDKYNSTYGVS